MKITHSLAWRWWQVIPLVVAGFIVVGCCEITPINLDRGPAPLRMPPPDQGCENETYEDCLTGGQIFTMYCNYCHNAPALAERPFSNFKNVAAHMRVRANLTGKEYAKLVAWLRRWSDVPPPNSPPEPSPKRLIYSQPIPELRPKETEGEAAKPPKKEEELPPPAAKDKK